MSFDVGGTNHQSINMNKFSSIFLFYSEKLMYFLQQFWNYITKKWNNYNNYVFILSTSFVGKRKFFKSNFDCI